VLRPDTRPQNFKYWRTLYNRFDTQLNSNQNINDALLFKRKQTSSLQDEAKLLEKKISQLKLQLAGLNREESEIIKDVAKIVLTEPPGKCQDPSDCEPIHQSDNPAETVCD